MENSTVNEKLIELYKEEFEPIMPKFETERKMTYILSSLALGLGIILQLLSLFFIVKVDEPNKHKFMYMGMSALTLGCILFYILKCKYKEKIKKCFTNKILKLICGIKDRVNIKTIINSETDTFKRFELADLDLFCRRVSQINDDDIFKGKIDGCDFKMCDTELIAGTGKHRSTIFNGIIQRILLGNNLEEELLIRYSTYKNIVQNHPFIFLCISIILSILAVCPIFNGFVHSLDSYVLIGYLYLFILIALVVIFSTYKHMLKGYSADKESEYKFGKNFAVERGNSQNFHTYLDENIIEKIKKLDETIKPKYIKILFKGTKIYTVIGTRRNHFELVKLTSPLIGIDSIKPLINELMAFIELAECLINKHNQN